MGNKLVQYVLHSIILSTGDVFEGVTGIFNKEYTN